ncbi:replication protein A 70 kDa DNA-binding subunit C [Trifolium repens]|nr:replication protein A 70 kDa DNA-binding subunit C [Trifolium repens]
MVYNEKCKLELEVDNLADILQGKENVRIRVRIVRLWKVPSFVNPSESISLEMVFVDEKGGKIHALVRKQLIYMFESKLEEGQVYDMSYFSIFPQYGFSFTEISEIASHTHEYEFLVARCIVVIQFAKIKIFREKTSIQNVMNTTRIMLNPDAPEVEKFKNSIAVHGIENISSVPIIGQTSKPSVDEEFLRMHPKKSISDLVEPSQHGVFAVCAEIVRIVDGKEWWYPTCKCHKSVVPDSGAYFCSGCDRHVFQVIPRFKIQIEVTVCQATAMFVLFDSDMSYMIEKSCAFFIAQSKAINSGPHPVEFDSLVGKKMLFVIEIPSKQSALSDCSYRVKRVNQVAWAPVARSSLQGRARGIPGSIPRGNNTWPVTSNVVDLDSNGSNSGSHCSKLLMVVTPMLMSL